MNTSDLKAMFGCNWFRFAVNLLLLSFGPGQKEGRFAGPFRSIIDGRNEYYANIRDSNRHDPSAAWTGVRTFKGRGTLSHLLFGIFLAALGLLFLFGASSAMIREFRISSDWIR